MLVACVGVSNWGTAASHHMVSFQNPQNTSELYSKCWSAPRALSAEVGFRRADAQLTLSLIHVPHGHALRAERTHLTRLCCQKTCAHSPNHTKPTDRRGLDIRYEGNPMPKPVDALSTQGTLTTTAHPPACPVAYREASALRAGTPLARAAARICCYCRLPHHVAHRGAGSHCA